MGGSRRYFDRVSTKWDEMRGSFFSEAVRERALDMLRVAPGRVAVDLGAGTGFMTEALLARGLTVIAVDQSGEMLRELRGRLGTDRVDCRVGEAERLPIDSASADYVVANMYLHHVEHPGVAIREAARILRPGGGLAISDLLTHEHAFLRREHHDRWLGFDPGAVSNSFAEAGLATIQVSEIGSTCDADSADGTSRASIPIFLATGWKAAARAPVGGSFSRVQRPNASGSGRFGSQPRA